jgi:SAM-dependent methyltransferase
VVRYGPLVADERALRLLGNVAGRRVLLLGAGAGQPAAALARAGARVIAVEPDSARVDVVRRHCAAQGVNVDVQERDLAELAFVRADTVDLVVSIFALAGVANLTRVFRQVHRVLRGDAPIVASLPHPMLATLEERQGKGAGAEAEPDRWSVDVVRDFGDERPVRWSVEEGSGVDHVHTTESLVTALSRAGFRLDILLEPLASAEGAETDPYWRPLMRHLPVALVVRARKLGA